ncbi:MAG TPA: sigma 54-interacting transcriptional regulator, partial [Blastocatellia bacterium]|nr:sigma 54-interacting transcriptional regulator [Blastocatellia bacterium]
MHAPQSVLVLLMGLHTATAHLDTLKSILEQASIEVLTLEAPPASCGADPGRLVYSATERPPSAIILFMDRRTLANNAQPGSFLGSLPADVPIIVAAQDFDASQIQTVLELGATDFIIPPFTSEGVLPRIWRLVRHSRLSSPPGRSVRERLGMRRLDLFGESPSFLEETRKLPLLARCDVTVMIRGETGTGKELIARALHYLSPRYDRPFVPIDCGAIPPELAESELFGHERGAFTGAVAKTPGLISTADQGTLFLDEVDGLGLSVQAKLLRFLQEMEYRPLGSNTIKRADVRVISASNGDLQKRVRNGEFREDLYYRLNVVQLRLPALRHRL